MQVHGTVLCAVITCMADNGGPARAVPIQCLLQANIGHSQARVATAHMSQCSSHSVSAASDVVSAKKENTRVPGVVGTCNVRDVRMVAVENKRRAWVTLLRYFLDKRVERHCTRGQERKIRVRRAICRSGVGTP